MWLRDLQLCDARPLPFPGLMTDLGVSAIGVVDLCLSFLRRKIATAATAKVVVELVPRNALPAPSVDPAGVANLRWPYDFGLLDATTDDATRKRLLLDALHGALRWVAGQLGWATGPLDDARAASLAAGLTPAGRALPRPVWSPNRQVGLNVWYEYAGRLTRAWVVTVDRQRVETARCHLLDVPAMRNRKRLVTHVAWLGNRWVNLRSNAYLGTTRFVVRLGPPLTATRADDDV